MRVIAGKYKGHHLVSFDAGHIRPTTDRVKETQFNIIGPQIEDMRVLDLFAGTGSLGFEAISRGARHVLFVEKNRKSIQIIEQNIKKLKITEPHQILMKDVMAFLKSYDGEPFDLILADPPFTEVIAEKVMIATSTSKVFGLNTLMTIESARKEPMNDRYGKLVRHNHREFGDKILSFFSMTEEPEGSSVNEEEPS